MEEERLVHPKSETPSPPVEGTAFATRGLPTDLVREGCRRLSWVGFLYALGFDWLSFPATSRICSQT